MAVQIDVGGQGKICLSDYCRERAQFRIQRDDWPPMFYCGNDLIQRVELYQKQQREIRCSDAATDALTCMGLAIDIWPQNGRDER